MKQAILLVAAMALGCADSKPPKKPSVSPPKSPPPSNVVTPDEPVEEGWGDLTGRFVFVGTPPERKAFKPQKADCVNHMPVDESVLVDEKGGLANVVLYIRDDVKVHPDYEASDNDEVVMDNDRCRFVPRITLLRVPQTLVIKNSDTFGHNTKGDLFANESFNYSIPAGGQQKNDKLTKAERLPATVGCNIHPFMSAYLLVRENPYMAASAADGTFTIKNLPTGEHEFQLWHEKTGYLRDVQVGDGQASNKGRVKITIKPGSNDLGEIKLDQSLFGGG